MKTELVLQLSLIKKPLKNGQCLLPALMKCEAHLIGAVDCKVLSGALSLTVLRFCVHSNWHRVCVMGMPDIS